MTRVFRKTVLVMAAALALSPLAAQAAEPGYADDAYAYERTAAGGEAYSYRRETSESGGAVVRGEVNCQGYCLPPGYTIEQPRPRHEPPPVRYEEQADGYLGEPDRYEEPARTGGGLVYGEREDRYGARRTSYEEGGGYSWGYEERGGWDRHEETREDWDRDRCRQRYDARGRLLESCGEIRLSDSFFWGGGGVGPEYIDGGGGGGGGGGGAYAEASAGAGAYASARASVGVSIRIGGGKRGHGGKGGHKGGGGCGKCGH